MATKWSTKWSTTVDPVEWSVDEVVSFLCDPTDTPWLPSSKSPRPDSTKLEAALRANDVCGEILLALDIETAKSLGLESLGQRMTLLKAVTWLKAQKSKELDEAPVGRLPHSPQTTITNATSPEPDNKPPKKVPRRLAPTIVTEGPPEANMVNAVKQGSNEFQKSGTREEAFFKLLLERWPPEAVDGDSPNLGLELYGDSDSEEELDPETWKEVLIENPHLQSAFGKPEHGSTGGPKVLSREICEKIIQFHIVSEEYAWCQKNLTGLSSELDPVWSDLRASNKIDAKKATFETSVAAFDTRLEKLKAAHLDGTFKSTKQLQKLCGSLDPTISNLSEVRWVLKLISTDNPPSKVALEHFKKSLEPPKPNDFGLEEDSEGQADSESELGGESLDSQLEDENPSRGSVDTAPFEAELTPHPQTNTETVKSTASESSDLIPLEDPFEYLEERSFTSLEQEQNKHDILAKLIMELNEEETEQIATLLDDLLPFIFLERAQRGLKRMLDNRDTGPSKDLERRSFMRVSALYLAWHTCHGINDTGIDRKLIEDTFRTIANKDESPAFNEFFDELKSLMEARRIRSGGRPRSNSQNTQNTSSTQSEADTDPIIISSKNPQTPIFLNSEIAKYIKSHQVEGIQFMWRELCESETPQGCLLAHEMGLGKTMQVITLLLTIAESCQSSDPRVQDQVPPVLFGGRTLILCPAALIQNWLEELNRWLPGNEKLGGIFHISRITGNRNSKESEGRQRLRLINEWSYRKGVLILSYDMFRGMISNPSIRSRVDMYSDEEHKQLEVILLRKTRIVVADEAHKLASASMISEFARRFKTKYRIAMTGTPLSNNLTEWFHMIDWISPGYLGGFNEFKAKFVSKIVRGMDALCSKTERRNGLKAQRLLNGILAPKYHRMEISAIASELPPKKEYAISIKLTGIQERAYNAFVSEAQMVPGLSPLSWLSLLQLCCNEPRLFLASLRQRRAQQNPNNAAPPLKSPTSNSPFNPSLALIEEVSSTLSEAPEIHDKAPFSHRLEILRKILEGSAQAGDKVVIFSQSLPTVNCLQQVLVRLGTNFRRIDGDSDSSERQSISRSFNSGDDVQVMIISTKAGGVGLNLYGANRVVIFDSTFNPMWENQAVGRAYRMGQRRPVYVYRLRSSGTFEDLLYRQALTKTELFHTIVNKKDVSAKGTKSKTNWLFRVRDMERQPIHDIMGGDPYVFDKIAAGTFASAIVAAEQYDFKEEDPQLTEEEKKEVELELVADANRRASARLAARRMSNVVPSKN